MAVYYEQTLQLLDKLNQKMTLFEKASVVAILIGSTWYYMKKRRERKVYKLPPGPRGWPIVGSLNTLMNEPRLYEVFEGMSKKYGDIFMVTALGEKTVVLNSAELVREAFLAKQNDFAGRNHTFSMDLLAGEGKSIIMGDFSAAWKRQRKIAHEVIRKYASGDHLQELVHHSFDMVSTFLERQTEPFQPMEMLSLYIYNIISSMCFGKTFELDDPFILDFIKRVDEANELFNEGFWVDFFPILQYLPNKRLSHLVSIIHDVKEYLEGILNEHEKTFDPENVTDLTSNLVAYIKGHGVKDEDGIALSREHIVNILVDIFFAGTDTTRYTITWAIDFLASNPEVQEKLYQQIIEVIGSELKPSLEHRARLPYCIAVLYETMRMRPVAPLALPHKALVDSSIAGYDIPKDTQILLNIYALHHDEKFWGDPEVFRPERFLDEDGSLSQKRLHLLPFSTGRRVCPGEVLAKTELQLGLALLIQHFKFSLPEGKEADLECLPGSFAMIPKNVELVCSAR